MQGIGGESHGDGIQQYTYSQEFIPRDSVIREIQIDIDKNGIESGGFLNWNVTDKKGNIISGGSISYEEVRDHAYTSLVLDKKVKFCEEQILEGQKLFCNGELLKGQGLVWAIEYEECVPLRLKVRILLFTLISAIMK